MTNLVNGTTRLQPICLLIGQAAGVLAHLSAKNDVNPGDVGVRDVQDILIDRGAYIMPYSEVCPQDPAFRSVQRIGATGILKGEGENIGWENHTLFHPDSILTLQALSEGLNSFVDGFTANIESNEISVDAAIKTLVEFWKFRIPNGQTVELNLDQIRESYKFGKFLRTNEITRKEFAVLLDAMIDPFHLKQVDHFGNFIE